jgi:hypothetical protein
MARARRLHFAAARLPGEGALPSLDDAAGWLNSPPLTADELRGKVVLVSFWTAAAVPLRGLGHCAAVVAPASALPQCG